MLWGAAVTHTLSISLVLVAVVAVIGAGGVFWYRRRRARREQVQREFLKALGDALARAKGSPDERIIELLVIGLYGMATKGSSAAMMATMADLLNAADTLRPRPAASARATPRQLLVGGDDGDLVGILLGESAGSGRPRRGRKAKAASEEPTEPLEDQIY
jgi:hypothetical protein